MNPAARAAAVVIALAGTVVALAALVRAVALAADAGRVWRLPAWWRDLGGDGSSWVVALVAAAVAALAVACLVLALRTLVPPRPDGVVETGGARVRLAALERLVAARLRMEVPGLVPLRVRVARGPGGWDVHVLADAPPADLCGLRRRAAAVAGPELTRAAGGVLAGLDLEVRRFTGRP